MSGRTFSFEVNRTSRAPAATLFRLETDGARWSEWAKPIIMQSGWEREGDPAPGGLGAVRKVGMWPLLVREETLEYEQDRRHVYALIGPATPVEGYRAEATFTPNASGGTDLRWRGSFTERFPGTGPVMRALLHGAIKFFSARLVTVAEREILTPPTD
ncbi:MAG: SRPBCC family protein [Mycobacteriaceae bacterium]|nr:SRPBCC family protein [Mycobacteriaceae bacterium]